MAFGRAGRRETRAASPLGKASATPSSDFQHQPMNVVEFRPMNGVAGRRQVDEANLSKGDVVLVMDLMTEEDVMSKPSLFLLTW